MLVGTGLYWLATVMTVSTLFMLSVLRVSLRTRTSGSDGETVEDRAEE